LHAVDRSQVDRRERGSIIARNRLTGGEPVPSIAALSSVALPGKPCLNVTRLVEIKVSF
jgi:hypothetical protein